MRLSKNFYIAVGAIFIALLCVLVLSLRDNAETLSANAFEGALQQNQFERLWIEDDYLYGRTNHALYKTLFMQIQPQVLKSIPLQKGQSKMLAYIILGIIFVFVFVVSFIIFRRNLGGGLFGFFGSEFGGNDTGQHRFNDSKLLSTKPANSINSHKRGFGNNVGNSFGGGFGNAKNNRGFGQESFGDSFLDSSIEPLHSNIKFSDVAGISEAKEELLEILDFLKHPAKYSALGISLPKGVLLSGAPGVGKTLIAKALAGESGVPFFYQSGASFVEMYVGVGAKRVRELFSAAKKSAPCIVFIDEIDAIGKKRTSDSHNSERESTLNQLLVEMDGFSDSSGVIVLGATNHIQALDSALLRSGRFDRKVFIELPNFAERAEILKMYLKSKKSHIDPVLIAKKTSSFSGAMLATLVNEAALNTARRGGSEIEERDFEAVYGKISSGKRRLPLLDEKAQKIYALYQASKIIFALKTSLPLQKATLFEASLLELNSHTIGTNELLNRIYFSLIGSVALWEYTKEGFGVGGEDFKKASELLDFGKKNGLFALPNQHLGGLFGNANPATQNMQNLQNLCVENLLKDKILLEFLQKNMTEILLAGGALLAYERLDWHGVESSKKTNDNKSQSSDKEKRDDERAQNPKDSNNGAEFVLSAFAPTVLTPFNALSKDYFNESKQSQDNDKAQNHQHNEKSHNTDFSQMAQTNAQDAQDKQDGQDSSPQAELDLQNPQSQTSDFKTQNLQNPKSQNPQNQHNEHSTQAGENFIVQNAEILADFIGFKF
ncbi:AAA family ATPase [Helicobacter sp. T3_23-1056]